MRSSPIILEFSSELAVPPPEVWRWMTSVQGITAEMMPIMKMTVPKHIRDISQTDVQPGQRLFRSYIFLFGFLPFDYSDLTLTEINPGVGFVEESPMGSMKRWRHERTLEAIPIGTRLTDRLTFEPRLARGLTRWFVRRFFEHRHKVLRTRLG